MKRHFRKLFGIFMISILATSCHEIESILEEDFDGDGHIGTPTYTFKLPNSSNGNISFKGSDNNGYIYDGHIVLTRVVSGIKDKFYKYRKFGHIYASPDGKDFYKYSGVRTLTIGAIEYEGGSY